MVSIMRFLFFVILMLCGCAPADRSIIFTSSADPAVKNGVAFDVASFDLRGCAKIAVPEYAIVETSDLTQDCHIELRKELDFMGHPPKSVTIENVRKRVGCASCIDGDTLVIGTFGEYSNEEGGTNLRIRLVLPSKITVERRPNLSGPKSAANIALSRGETPNNSNSPILADAQWTIMDTKPSPEDALQDIAARRR